MILQPPTGGTSQWEVSISWNKNNLQSYYLRNALEYNKAFKDQDEQDKHTLKLFLGQEFRYTDRDNQSFDGYGYQFNRGGVVFTDPRIIEKVIADNAQYFDRSNRS